MNQRDVAKAMDWSLSKLLRIETGAVSVTTNDMRVLLAHYGITDADRIAVLIDLARAGKERSWASAYREVASSEYISYLGYESSASVIRNFEPFLVPGLLQTEEYARLAILNTVDKPNPKKINALVELRTERQEIVTRDDSPGLHFLLDEAVIRRSVGGADVMRRQLRHLQEVATRPNVTIRIVPFTQGLYPRLRVPYVLFEFPDPEDEGVLYIENPRGEMIIREHAADEEDEITPMVYLGIFFQLEQVARKEDAAAMLDAAIRGLADLPPRMVGLATEDEVIAGAGAGAGEAEALG